MYIEALKFANDKHKGQKRANGESYIVHPIEVSLKFLPMRANWETRIVALLHDVIEDTKTTESELVEMFGYKIGWQVGILTRESKLESYEEYINRIKKYGPETVRKVKIADLKHNLSTIDNIPDLDKRKRLKERYEKALTVL